MAVMSNKLESILRLKVKTGIDENGKDKLAVKSYNNVKTDATNDAIYDVARLINSLETTPAVSIMRQDSFELVQG